MMYRTVACHGETASPGVGRAVCPTILEVSFICLLGIAVIGKIGRHVRFLPQKKKKKKKIWRGPGLPLGVVARQHWLHIWELSLSQMGVQSHTARWSAQHWRTVQWQDCWHISMATYMA